MGPGNSNTTSIRYNSSRPQPYLCSNLGLMLPLVDESSWSTSTRAVLYFVAMIYCFFGISIAADVFMCAIEKITSQTRTVKVKHPEFGSTDDLDVAAAGGGNGQISGRASVREIRVWNPTVANLTLMALGSSAPEILLSVIEIAGNGFKAGPLGPSTIVGSAAFNLFVITGVCVSSIPTPETRRISEIMVFGITAVCCILAYLWLLVILKISSPEVVEIWEASVTLLFFLVLVLAAYSADKKVCLKWVSKKKVSIMMPPEEYSMNGTKKNYLKDLRQKEYESEKTAKTMGAVEGGPDKPQADPGLEPEPEIPGSASSPREPPTERPQTAASRAQTASGFRHITTKGIRLIKSSSGRPETAKSPLDALGNTSRLILERELAKRFPHASAELLARLTAQKIEASREHSRLYYRIAASKWLAASGKTPQETPRPSTPPPSAMSRPMSAISNLRDHW